MLSNAYTKEQILQELSSKGYYIDTYTLDTFFEQSQIEAIFENEQGVEFFDKDTLDMILSSLFEKSKEEVEQENEQDNTEDSIETSDYLEESAENTEETVQDTNTELQKENESQIEQNQETESVEQEQSFEKTETESVQNENSDTQENTIQVADENLMQQTDNVSEQETQEDFDDMSLISDSFEAQEKFREYVVSQVAKSGVDMSPKAELKLDVSDRALNMVANAMAKKITKYITTVYRVDSGSTNKLEELQEKNKQLEKKVKTLEEQNKKLRMLLAESNKNLNSYKPGPFGLYKKETPKK